MKFWIKKLLHRLCGEKQITFQCNLCGRHTSATLSEFGREQVSCRCGSSVRLRAIIHLVSSELLGKSMPLTDFPVRRDIVGIELSGAPAYADKFAKKLGYTNTFYHKPPQLDITDLKNHPTGTYDFIISSDVFEHIAPPVSRAFENTFKLLKPGGVFILTVPYTKEGDTVEHFPDLYEYHIELRDKERVLINKKCNGDVEEFKNLVFHGGEGETLEMRIFSEQGVLYQLMQAGFVDIAVHHEMIEAFGIYWSEAWSLPITARKPRETGV